MTDTESIYGGFYTKRARPVTSEQKVTDLKIDSERPYTHYFKSRGDKA